MHNNKINVKIHLANGGEIEVLKDAGPKEAISEYFYPDAGKDVQTLVISFIDDKGKKYSISIFPGGVVVRDTVV